VEKLAEAFTMMNMLEQLKDSSNVASPPPGSLPVRSPSGNTIRLDSFLKKRAPWLLADAAYA
jgi:hypothetical protein